MNVVVSQEHRFDRTPDGVVWTQAAFPRSYYEAYLKVFDTVRVVARVREVNAPPPDAKRADGDKVSFHAIPYYLGPEQYLRKWWQIRKAFRNAVGKRDAVIFRVQSPIAAGIEPELHRRNHPYALEVMCDPYEMFAPHSNHHLLRPAFRMLFYKQLKKQCHQAAAVSYVTEYSLQKRYPPSTTAVSTSYSTVELPPEAYALSARSVSVPSCPLKIITVASLDQPYKGVDVLIDAVAASVASGFDWQLQIVGDGLYRSQLEARVKHLGSRVQFLGQLPSGAPIRKHLDHADLFILPSRTEGLPRAMIEAMACALPCLGSAVGGIPELLPSSDLVQPGDPVALANKIQEVAQSPERMTAMSAQNLHRSRYYAGALLRARRYEFYCHLKDLTESWLRKQGERHS